MQWNWQRGDWPHFTYQTESLEPFEREILHHSGYVFGVYEHLEVEDKQQLSVDLISHEALKTSEIEGLHLDHASLQSSIQRHFGLKEETRRVPLAEKCITDLMIDLYQTYHEPLSHSLLYRWHQLLMQGTLEMVGCYRGSEEPMQIISGPMHAPIIHFEAPPSSQIKCEMDRFIDWFNRTAPDGESPLPVLTRMGIAHLYFESVHPFEDGNGRLGRALAEKIFAQAFKKPILLALSTVIQKKKKIYYAALEETAKNNEITPWLMYFAETVQEALLHTERSIFFLLAKSKLMAKLSGQLHPRQEKCVLRLFREGVEGFKGGLSAENYMRITGATRPTATRDLSDLVHKQALVKKGERRYTRYYLNV
jgi:Fic family protein